MTFDIDNPAPAPTSAMLNASDEEQADYLEDLAQRHGALWHSPLDRARVMVIASRLRLAAGRADRVGSLTQSSESCFAREHWGVS